MPRARYKSREYEEICKEVNIAALAAAAEECFGDIEDPRIVKRCVYPAWFLILVILMGTLAGGDTIWEIAGWAHYNADLLGELSGGRWAAPSYNVIWSFIVCLKPVAMKSLLQEWFQALPPGVIGKRFTIDGKESRGARHKGPKVNLVGLYATERGLAAAVEKVSEKKDEPSALPALLSAVNLTDALITFDAVYTNIKNLQLVLAHGAAYLAAVKKNQPTLHAELTCFFDQAVEAGPEYVDIEEFLLDGEGKAHGRKEARYTLVSHATEWLQYASKDFSDWGIQTLIRIIRERTENSETTTTTHFYISSAHLSAEEASKAVRSHWHIENCQHYVLDVVWKEDACLANRGYAAENLGAFRRIARNLITITDPNRGFAEAVRAAKYSRRYLLGTLKRLFIKSL